MRRFEPFVALATEVIVTHDPLAPEVQRRWVSVRDESASLWLAFGGRLYVLRHSHALLHPI